MHALPRAWWLVALGSVAVLHATPTTAAIYVFRADRCNTNANSGNVWEGGGGTMEIRNTSAMSASSISFGATTGSTVGSTVHVDVLLQGRLSAGGGLNLEVSLLPLARDSALGLSVRSFHSSSLTPQLIFVGPSSRVKTHENYTCVRSVPCIRDDQMRSPAFPFLGVDLEVRSKVLWPCLECLLFESIRLSYIFFNVGTRDTERQRCR